MKNKVFGIIPNGDDVYSVELVSGDLSINVITFGAILQDMRFRNKPVVLGYNELEPYLKNPYFYGATIGRFANRLKNGSAQLRDETIQSEINSKGGHHIHGGSKGSSYKNWDIIEQSQTYVILEVLLPDGEMGFPGNLLTQVKYELIPNNSLKISITASTDKETLCSFAHHSYFNLGDEELIQGHNLEVLAEKYVDVDENGIPVRICKVDDSLFDFRIKKEILSKYIIDHNFCLKDQKSEISKAASLSKGKILLELSTTEPGLQVYNGHKLGIALEPQIWPDAPNNVSFPSAILKPGELYKQQSIFKFTYGNL